MSSQSASGDFVAVPHHLVFRGIATRHSWRLVLLVRDLELASRSSSRVLVRAELRHQVSRGVATDRVEFK
jgi:hypothetical protein